MIKETVEYSPDGDYAMEIRTLFCRVAAAKASAENPLIETNFNDLLDKVAQEAFDDGRAYERKPKR
jgi:hypothetical protein